MKNGIFSATLAAAALAASGCVGYEVKPPKPAAYAKADAPAPLRVGVLVKTAPFVWDGMGMSTSRMDRYRGWSSMRPLFAQVDGIGGKFVDALSGSRAFLGVDVVQSMGFSGSDAGGHNLYIDAQFSGKYSQDPAQFPKAFISGFLMFLPVPFIRYDDTFRASADLSVYDAGGRLVHKYSEQQDVGTEAALFSAGMPGTLAAGIESASANLAAKLVSALVADREGFVRASRTSGETGRDKPAAESKAAWYETAPAAAATPAAAPPVGAEVHAPIAAVARKEPPPEAAPDEAPSRPAAAGPRLTAAQAASELLP